MNLAFERARVLVPPDVLVRELDGESVILDLKTERYFGLDDVGTRMLTVLAASESIQAGYERLLEEYEVEPGPLRADITGLVDRLLEQGLVQVVEKQLE